MKFKRVEITELINRVKEMNINTSLKFYIGTESDNFPEYEDEDNCCGAFLISFFSLADSEIFTMGGYGNATIMKWVANSCDLEEISNEVEGLFKEYIQGGFIGFKPNYVYLNDKIYSTEFLVEDD